MQTIISFFHFFGKFYNRPSDLLEKIGSQKVCMIVY